MLRVIFVSFVARRNESKGWKSIAHGNFFLLHYVIEIWICRVTQRIAIGLFNCTPATWIKPVDFSKFVVGDLGVFLNHWKGKVSQASPTYRVIMTKLSRTDSRSRP